VRTQQDDGESQLIKQTLTLNVVVPFDILIVPSWVENSTETTVVKPRRTLFMQIVRMARFDLSVKVQFPSSLQQ
jgi:hypothetical protein